MDEYRAFVRHGIVPKPQGPSGPEFGRQDSGGQSSQQQQGQQGGAEDLAPRATWSFEVRSELAPLAEAILLRWQDVKDDTSELAIADSAASITEDDNEEGEANVLARRILADGDDGFQGDAAVATTIAAMDDAVCPEEGPSPGRGTVRGFKPRPDNAAAGTAVQQARDDQVALVKSRIQEELDRVGVADRVDLVELDEAIGGRIRESGPESQPDKRRFTLMVNMHSKSLHDEQGLGVFCNHEITHVLRAYNDSFQPWAGMRNNRARFGLRALTNRSSAATEEGLATLNGLLAIDRDRRFLRSPALLYLASVHAQTMGLPELYKHLEQYEPKSWSRYCACRRAKRGVADLSLAGASGKPQVYFEGAVEILRNVNHIDFRLLHSGRISVRDIGKATRLVRGSGVRLPPYLRGGDTEHQAYISELRRIAALNMIKPNAPSVPVNIPMPKAATPITPSPPPRTPSRSPRSRPQPLRIGSSASASTAASRAAIAARLQCSNSATANFDLQHSGTDNREQPRRRPKTAGARRSSTSLAPVSPLKRPVSAGAVRPKSTSSSPSKSPKVAPEPLTMTTTASESSASTPTPSAANAVDTAGAADEQTEFAKAMTTAGTAATVSTSPLDVSRPTSASAMRQRPSVASPPKPRIKRKAPTKNQGLDWRGRRTRSNGLVEQLRFIRRLRAARAQDAKRAESRLQKRKKVVGAHPIAQSSDAVTHQKQEREILALYQQHVDSLAHGPPADREANGQTPQHQPQPTQQDQPQQPQQQQPQQQQPQQAQQEGQQQEDIQQPPHDEEDYRTDKHRSNEVEGLRRETLESSIERPRTAANISVAVPSIRPPAPRGSVLSGSSTTTTATSTTASIESAGPSDNGPESEDALAQDVPVPEMRPVPAPVPPAPSPSTPPTTARDVSLTMVSPRDIRISETRSPSFSSPRATAAAAAAARRIGTVRITPHDLLGDSLGHTPPGTVAIRPQEFMFPGEDSSGGGGGGVFDGGGGGGVCGGGAGGTDNGAKSISGILASCRPVTPPAKQVHPGQEQQPHPPETSLSMFSAQRYGEFIRARALRRRERGIF